MKNNIGIVGGGQLGRMLAFDAKRMGFTVRVVDPTPNSPAGQVVDEQVLGDYVDKAAIRKLAEVSDYLTFEIELANAVLLDELSAKGLQVNPSAKTLTLIKDKLSQKEFLQKAGILVAEFANVIASNSEAIPKRLAPPIASVARKDVISAAKDFGYPFLLKARFDAYDGRGNVLIRKEKDINAGLEKLKGRKLYVEKFVPFVKELAVIVARNAKGEIATYPVVETIHKNNICHIVIAPAQVSPQIKNQAKRLAIKTMRHLKGAGVFGIEMFLTKDNKVLINEIAPRVHNSGHYTTEACVTSQFEQHIRAITGMPLGSTAMRAPAAVMVNILGDRVGKAEVTGMEKALSIQNVFVHIYGKSETKPERKMGHITVVGESVEEAMKKARLARKYISI